MSTETRVPTYLELISKDEKTVQKENLKITAQEAALNVSREILALSSEETMLKAEVEKAKRAIPYSVATEYKATQRLQEIQARLAFANEIKDNRFSDATI